MVMGEVLVFPGADDFLKFMKSLEEQYNEQKNKDDGCGEL